MRRFLLLFLISGFPLLGQSNTGELRLSVIDPSGLGVKSSVELVCEANQFQQSFETDEGGNVVAKRLPFGVYRLRVERSGFAEFTDSVEIRSAIPDTIRLGRHSLDRQSLAKLWARNRSG
jgi:hypothetical protein